MSMAEELKRLRKLKSMSQKSLADMAGVTQGTISQLETGLLERVSFELAAQLCRALDVPLDHFAPFLAPGVTVPPPPSVATFQIHPVDIPSQPPIPILGTVGAGPALDDPIYDQVLDFAKLFAGDLAAYTVIGDSMREAHILSGDTIIIRKTPSPAPGEDVVAWIDAHKGCVIKTFRGGRATLGWLASDDGWRHDLTEADTVYGALVSIIRSKRPAIVQKPKKKPKKGE